MCNTKINSVWILRIDPYRHIKVLQIHWYSMYTFMENPRIDGKWILFKNGAEIGKDKKRFFFLFSVINADMFLWYPCAPCIVVKKCYFRPVRECGNKFRKFISKFFLFGCFSVFSMCNLLWKRSFVLYSCFLYLHSTTIKCNSTSSTFCALMKLNDGFCWKVFYSCTVIEHVPTCLHLDRTAGCGVFITNLNNVIRSILKTE